MKVQIAITLEDKEELNVPLMHELLAVLRKYPKGTVKALIVEVK